MSPASPGVSSPATFSSIELRRPFSFLTRHPGRSIGIAYTSEGHPNTKETALLRSVRFLLNHSARADAWSEPRFAKATACPLPQLPVLVDQRLAGAVSYHELTRLGNEGKLVGHK